MKTIIRISMLVVLSVATCACVKEVTFRRDDIKPQLMLNAQMVAGDTLHTVYMAISRNDRIGKIASGTVKCYVNGILVADGKQDNRDDTLFVKEDWHYDGIYIGDRYDAKNSAGVTKQTRYTFKADFKPGDVVRIEAEADGGVYKAYSEVTVPKAPTISTIDTLFQKSSHGFAQYKIRVKGKDIVGDDNYYRIVTGNSIHDIKTRNASKYSEAKTWEETSGYRYVEFEKGNDPILNDGATSSEQMDVEGASVNTFRVFSDRQFADGTFSIGFTVGRSDILPRPDNHGSNWYDRMERESNLIVTVYGISEELYHYLKALSIYNYMDGDMSILESVSFPDNVNGGIGLVSISTPAVATVTFRRNYISQNVFN